MLFLMLMMVLMLMLTLALMLLLMLILILMLMLLMLTLMPPSYPCGADHPPQNCSQHESQALCQVFLEMEFEFR